MKSGLRIACFVAGFLWIACLSVKSDFATFFDFLAVFMTLAFPTFLMALPVVLEYKERKRVYKIKQIEEE